MARCSGLRRASHGGRFADQPHPRLAPRAAWRQFSGPDRSNYRFGREATATLAYLLHPDTTGRAERLPGEVENWRSILP
jgi:hypothetical protein